MAIKKIKLPDNSEVSVQDSRVPDVTTTDNGKYLGVSSGVWAALSKPSYTLDEVSDGSTRKLADYLPLSAGSEKPLSGDLYLGGNDISGVGNVDSVLHFDTTNSRAGINTDTPFDKFHVHNSKTVATLSSDSATIDTSVYALTIGHGASRTASNGRYMPGIAFNHMFGNYAPYTATYFKSPQAWIGLKLNNLNGSELSSLVFATKSGTTYNDAPLERVVIDPRGNTSVDGNITATGTITPGSDSRIKGKQKEISKEYAFGIIERLTPKTWEWNEVAGDALVGKKAAGLVAQEVREVLPEAVSMYETEKLKDFHSLNYNTIQGYEIAAIKGLIEEVISLKAEIVELKKQIK